jgi:hypothetical protein
MVPKKSLILRLLTFACAMLALVSLAPSVRADVKNGETYKCGSQGNVTVSVTPNGTTGDCTVTTTHDGTTSNGATGTPGATAGSCTESGDMTVPDSDGDGPDTAGPTTRVNDGKLQYKNANGDWIDCGAPRKQPKRTGSLWEQVRAGDPAPFTGRLYYQLSPGDDVTSLPLLQGDTVPYDGFMSPGEEVTSLPVVAAGGPDAATPGEEGSSLPLTRS